MSMEILRQFILADLHRMEELLKTHGQQQYNSNNYSAMKTRAESTSVLMNGGQKMKTDQRPASCTSLELVESMNAMNAMNSMRPGIYDIVGMPIPCPDEPSLIRRSGSVRGIKNGVKEAKQLLQLQQSWKVSFDHKRRLLSCLYSCLCVYRGSTQRKIEGRWCCT